jgi:thiol-disulfide isomerase/thioredoxin
MAPKRNSKTKSRTKKAKNTRRVKADGMDIASEQDLGKLSDLLAKHKIVVVLVHADWCGHCQTFKPLWEDYKKIPGRNVPMVSVNEKVLAKTPFKDAKLDGFPSTLVYSGKDGSFGSFKKENGEETHSVPNARDKAVMTQLLKVRPSAMKRNNANTNTNTNMINSESAHATPEAEALLEQSGKMAVREKDKPMRNLWAAEPPDTASDNVK